MHTNLLDYNRKGRGRCDPIFKGVNICIRIWTNFCTPCVVMVLNQRILLCFWLFFKQKGYIYCPHSTIWLTSYKIVRITGWKRAIRKQIHACTYMYTQWPVLYDIVQKLKSLFAHINPWNLKQFHQTVSYIKAFLWLFEPQNNLYLWIKSYKKRKYTHNFGWNSELPTIVCT